MVPQTTYLFQLNTNYHEKTSGTYTQIYARPQAEKRTLGSSGGLLRPSWRKRMPRRLPRCCACYSVGQPAARVAAPCEREIPTSSSSASRAASASEYSPSHSQTECPLRKRRVFHTRPNFVIVARWPGGRPITPYWLTVLGRTVGPIVSRAIALFTSPGTYEDREDGARLIGCAASHASCA
jgi:hypothetical protein